jgi:hypothetical protein
MNYERKPLWETIAEIINLQDPAIHMLISMREEWLGAWYEAVDYIPEAFRSTLRLFLLNKNELLRAVIKPSEISGIIFDNHLAEIILDEIKRPNAYGLGEEYVESGLLQLICRRLWDEAEKIGEKQVSVSLYNSIGRAERIVKEFVWNELGKAGNKKSQFTASDRVLWVGLSRHLVLAQGVKAIISPKAIAQKVLIQDFGAFGKAVIAGTLGRKVYKYLEIKPEKRKEPSNKLVQWISKVLDKGVKAGFLKKQMDFQKKEKTEQSDISKQDDTTTLYELSHDSIGDILQQFAIEFVKWSQLKIYYSLAAIYLLIILLSLLTIYILYPNNIAEAIRMLKYSILLTAFYAIVLWLFMILYRFISEIVFYPFVRLLAKGEMRLGSFAPVKDTNTNSNSQDLQIGS